ncbi:hypothetical protein [Nocardia sp. NRRL S-836]|uniref:hypothetical protein n=1 Tax=Nocardia sp. NRRL S-836 TaxID=1519492 RepID=UPI0006AF4A09|nr:hypothetical protein [Nocardia sp. NRRL S-836]KOV84711.1 hypothetical protein ADL03_15685 [Nocardia sp. NRRL S-836]
MVTRRQETNVRVLPCVLEALGRIALAQGMSRDEAVRQVLAEHIAAQEAREPEDRLTHIATVLRHPQPARRGKPRVDRPLRLRLPEGLADRARAVSLHLPGQYPRAHKDYVSRLLTDAVTTAIAVREPFTDSVLDGLLPVLRHKAALALWQLAIAVTITRPELAIQDSAEDIRARIGGTLSPPEKRLLLIAEQLDEHVSWHASFRFAAAANLARTLLSGNDATANETMLYKQEEDWNELRLDLRHDEHRGRWLKGVAVWNADGRGSTAVWRAGRKVDLQDFTDWLLALDGHTPADQVMFAPGWVVHAPAGWATHIVPRGHTLPEQFARWAEQNRVIVWSVDGRQVVWPVRPGHPEPVPGFEPVAAVARTLQPSEIVELIEAVLIEWGTHPTGTGTDAGIWRDEDEGPDPYDAQVDAEHETPNLWLPVDKAFEFGFIDAEQRSTAMSAARAYTRKLTHWRDNVDPVVAKPEATLDPQFRLFVTRRRDSRTAKPMWLWPRASVAREVFAGTSSTVIGWLSERALWMARWTVHGTMEQAWHDGFDHYSKAFWRPEGLPDDPFV